MSLSSWLWSLLRPRRVTGFFQRCSCPSTARYCPLSCVSNPRPLSFHSCRWVRKRCGVCIRAINSAARIGPIPGIWRSRFHALCFLLSTNRSRRTLKPANVMLDGPRAQPLLADVAVGDAALLAQEPQHIELLVVVFSAPPYAGFGDLV